MINGHGDDIYNYGNIRINFSSNVPNGFEQNGLYDHLTKELHKLSNYPEPEPYSLEEELAQMLGIGRNEVLVTNGATEAIYLIAQAHRGAKSAIPIPTFSEYADACSMHNHTIDFVSGLSELNESHQLVWICNPNNPTGQILPLEQLTESIDKHCDKLFVIDCSYAPFTQEKLIDVKHAAELPNVILLHSMTKQFAVPGIRLGYATANANLMDHIRKQRMPWSVNQLAISAGHYLISHRDDYRLEVSQQQSETTFVAEQLRSIGNIEVLPTLCHFMLCRTLKSDALSLKKYLAENLGILIREASNFKGLDKSYFRIAVKRHDENLELINGIRQWMKSL